MTGNDRSCQGGRLYLAAVHKDSGGRIMLAMLPDGEAGDGRLTYIPMPAPENELKGTVSD